MIHVCRFCQNPRDRIRYLQKEEHRTLENYLETLEIQELSKSTHLKKLYIEKQLCPLIYLPNVGIFKLLPPDVPHTEFIGILRDEWQYLMCYCISNEFFQLHHFVNQLNQFRRVYDLGSNLPFDISEKFVNQDANFELKADEV